jgi:aspartokinase-like uncharacterized kinase
MEDAKSSLRTGRLPVLAPHAWLRHVDPLPHSWEVTSDSIAAWVTISCGATDLVLLKPVRGPLSDLTDPYLAECLTRAGQAAPRVSVCTSADVESVIAECVAFAGSAVARDAGVSRDDLASAW